MKIITGLQAKTIKTPHGVSRNLTCRLGSRVDTRQSQKWVIKDLKFVANYENMDKQSGCLPLKIDTQWEMLLLFYEHMTFLSFH